MTLPKDFTFDYEKPEATRRGKMRTPVSIYLPKAKATGGILFISSEFLRANALEGKEIALQIKGTVDTYVIFNPPKNAPRFFRRASSPKKGTVAYSCSEVVRKLMSTFGASKEDTIHELWLDRVGEFSSAQVYRLRNTLETDTIYQF